MSWCHCSTADGEACVDGGLLSNQRATTSVVSTPTTGGDILTVLAVRLCCGAVAAAMAPERPPALWDLPAREREVSSFLVSCSQREG
jgi:hypothetical protein